MKHRERLEHVHLANQLAEQIEELQLELLRANVQNRLLQERIHIALGFLKIRHVRRARKVLEAAHET